MSGLRIPAARWPTLGLAFAFVISLLAPVATTLASTDLTPGDDAVIVNANGDLIRLRTKPGTDGGVVGEYPEGTPVRVVDGPRTADDGAVWYRVSVEGESGYMAAEFLELAGAPAPAPEPAPEPGDVPSDDSSADESVGLPPVTGTATIVNTNGDPIRCRAAASADAEIISQFLGGDVVELTDEPVDGWQPVICAGRAGFVHSGFVGTPTGVADEPSDQTADAGEDEGSADGESDDIVVMAEVVGAGTISGTNGDGVRCRSRASTDSNVVAILSEGGSVELRGTARNDWFPVYCNGKRGYVWADFVSVSSSGGSNGGGSGASGAGTIVNTGGSGLRCRNKASFEGEVITTLVEGDQVELRGTKRGEWQPVYCAGKKGYVHADYVSASGGGNSGGGSNGGSNGGGSSSGLQNGDAAKVSGTGGDGVRFRSAASSGASVISVLAEGTVVDVTRGSTGDWVAVTYRGSSGFVHKDFLVKTSSGNGSGGGNSGGGSSGSLSSGDHAKVTETLNFRSKASSSGGVLGVAMPGTVVLVTGGKQNGYFPVEWGGMDGFMHGDYLAWTDAALSPGSSGVGGNAGGGSPSSVGQAIVDYAMRYDGYPYVWATAGPNSFDCSGFTYWVAKNVLGMDIGRGLWTQIVVGTPVSYGDLRPGDLVFFQNTYTWGLSHNGIYIGNNKFIHAENEETGVKISDITSTYYSSRWYGAVRLG